MKYGATRLGTNWPEGTNPWWVKALYIILFFIPRANPDNEPLYPKVDKWLVELDEENIPETEIGLDKHGNPIFYAPDDRNYGFFTDASGPFEDPELEPISKEYFYEKLDILKSEQHHRGNAHPADGRSS